MALPLASVASTVKKVLPTLNPLGAAAIEETGTCVIVTVTVSVTAPARNSAAMRPSPVSTFPPCVEISCVADVAANVVKDVSDDQLDQVPVTSWYLTRQ